MRLAWYYHRLRSMPPAEVAWRGRCLIRQYWERLACSHWERRFRAHEADPAVSLAALNRIRFWGVDEVMASDLEDAWREAIVAAAERALEHRFRYLALGEISLGSPVRFNREYKRGIETPLAFGPWMDYRDTEAYGEFKYFWELPRLQHLIGLAKAYHTTGQESYADEVAAQLADFREQAPYLRGVNWTVSMEAGIRLLSLSWITGFLRAYLATHTEVLSLIESLVRSHVHHLARHYARFSSANNHLVGEAAGVFVGALCFGHLPGMRSQRERAQRILCREIERQHFKDGVNREQSTHYQVFAWHFFAVAGLLGEANGMPFPGSYWDLLQRSADFIGSLGYDHQTLPQIGDSDDGRALGLVEADDEVTVMLQTAAVLRGGAPEGVGGGPRLESTVWLLGRRALCPAKPRKAARPEPGGAIAFKEGGYYVLKHEGHPEVKLVLDCGPLGFGSLAAHGHADALSFMLTISGQRIFVDPGTYTYVKSNPFRDYFRSTAAHNTVVVDACSQSLMAGPFLWRQRALAQLDRFAEGSAELRVEGRHDGYRRLEDPVTHVRAITLAMDAGRIGVEDRLEARGRHDVCLCFHLPGCKVTPAGRRGGFDITSGDVSVSLLADPSLEWRCYRGSDEPRWGWFSAAYDRLEPTTTIVGHGVTRGMANWRTEIEWD